MNSTALTSGYVYTYSASYDGVGNVTGYADTKDKGASSIMGTWSFQYDTLNRLVNGTATAGYYFTGNTPYACWSYDDFGNRTAQNLQSTACSSGFTSTATYNANNQVTWTTVNSAVNGFQYDASGDVLNDNANTYLYDAEGRVCAVKSAPVGGLSAMTGYIYDADGTRVAKGTITSMNCDPASNGFTLTERYVLGSDGQELTMLDGSGAWQRTNVFAGGRQLATYDMVSSTPTLHFQILDPLGTRRMQTNADGQPETDIQSLPYGDQLRSFNDQYAPGTADDATPLHFTGKERDSESGNDYFNARYFASSMGRMLSPDPLGGDLTDPQSLNKYAYVLNNPLRFTDPTGLYTCKDSSDCSSKADVKFEKTLARFRGSKNADVARAANAYGAAGKDNGVSVGFANLSGKGENGNTVSTVGADANGNPEAKSDVTINSKASGADYDAAVGHEGSHVADAQDVVSNGLTEDGRAIHARMNITPYQSEQRAFGVTNAILSQEVQSRNFQCSSGTCTLGAGVLPAQVPGIVDRMVGSYAVYNQGGKPMGPNNQGPSQVNGVTPKATVPSIPR